MANFGYAGEILFIDLDSGKAAGISTADYSEGFLGGRGMAARVYWDEVPSDTGPFDASNRVIFAAGPLGGLPVIGGSRWQVCGKSPAVTPPHFSYGSFGGRWGAELKFAGYDALVIQGKSEKPVYLFLHDSRADLRDASALWGKGAVQTRALLKDEWGSSVKVAAIGPAGENMAIMANLVADNDATGARGLGAVMGAKKLKAIVVRRSQRQLKIAHPERLRELTRYFRELDRKLTGVVDGVSFKIAGPNVKKDPCYGCHGNCIRVIYEAKNGQKGKYMCGGATFYQLLAESYYGQQTEVPFQATRLCDDYGLDLMPVDAIIYWLQRCYKAGILTDENTGIPISKLGSLEFVDTLLRKISSRDGFGDALSQGLAKAAAWAGHEAEGLVPNFLFQGDQPELYGPRLYLTHALLYATEPRMPIQALHQTSQIVGRWLNWLKNVEGACVSPEVLRAIARRFWGSEIAADLSTYEGKALAAKKIQDREYAKECLGLCDYLWPIMDTECSDDHAGDPGLESKILSAVTGKEIDEDGLNAVGERVFNLQRAILAREGHRGRESDVLPDAWHTVPLKIGFPNTECLVPGKDGQAVSRKGAVVDRERFEKMKDEYYQLRGWDMASGLQTRPKLEELGLADIAGELEQRGILA